MNRVASALTTLILFSAAGGSSVYAAPGSDELQAASLIAEPELNPSGSDRHQLEDVSEVMMDFEAERLEILNRVAEDFDAGRPGKSGRAPVLDIFVIGL